jgi:HK97 family phage portal protein
LANIFHRLGNAYQAFRFSIENPNIPVFEALNSFNLSDTGVTVSVNNVLHASAFYNGVMQIGDSLASYPKAVIQMTDKSKKKVDHKINEVLREPNESMTQFQFFHAAMVNTLTFGNALAYIDYKNKKLRNGRPMLRLVDQSERPEISINNGVRFYKITLFDGTKLDKVPERDIIHVPGLSFDGWQGIDVVTNFKNTLGLALSQEKFNSEFYKNGASSSGYIKVPGKLGDGQGEKVSDEWSKKYAGLGNHHSIPVIGSGSEYVQLSVNPEAAQFLQSRQFSIEEIARMLNIPPHKLKHLLHGTMDNIESQEVSYHSSTMQPWVIRFEEELTRKLLSEDEKKDHMIDFDMNSILRADISAKAQYYDTGIKGQWLVPNDVRILEGYNPVEWGDKPVDFQKTQIDDNQNKPPKKSTRGTTKTKK